MPVAAVAMNVIRSYIVHMHTIRRDFGHAAILLALLVALVLPVAAIELTTDDGAVIDMPSGFTPGEGDGKRRFSYFSPSGEIEFDILIREPGSSLRPRTWPRRHSRSSTRRG